jgi:hypothetical protein
VHIVAVAVVAAATDEDGFERRRAIRARRHHQRIDGAPRLPHHADIAVAGRVRRDLGDDLRAIGELLVGVLVGEHAFGIAGALEIDADAEIVVIGEPRIHLAVGDHGAVAPPIGHELHDRRAFLPRAHGLGVVPEVSRKPDRRLAGILHRKEDVLRVRDFVAHREIVRLGGERRGIKEGKVR